MPVNLSHMKEILMVGLRFRDAANLRLTPYQIPKKYHHIHAVFDVIEIKTFGDLNKIPRRIELPDGTLYEKTETKEWCEHPQGWGRTRNFEPGVDDHPCWVYGTKFNKPMTELHEEIGKFIDDMFGPNYEVGISERRQSECK